MMIASCGWRGNGHGYSDVRDRKGSPKEPIICEGCGKLIYGPHLYRKYDDQETDKPNR